MYIRFANSFKSHTLFYLYTSILILILYGVVNESGYKHFFYLSIYVFSFFIGYLLFRFSKIFLTITSFTKLSQYSLPLSKANIVALSLAMISFFIVLFHLFLLKGSPQIQSFYLETSDEVALLRRNITLITPIYVKYLSSILVKAVFPFLLLYFFHKRMFVLYFIVFFISCFYGFALMQKSYILTILTPIGVYSLLQKKYVYFIKHCFVIVGVTLIITLSANTDIKTNVIENEKEGTESFFLSMNKLCQGIQNRVLLVPGRVVSEWFDVIPEQKPYLHGNGYRLLAKIKGERFVNYAIELYPVLRPQYVERGLQGSVNSASFMYDFANFGIFGLILSGILLSLFLTVIEAMFITDFRNKISLNLFNIMILSSAALPTTLLSGGWLTVLLLYILFKKQLTT